MKAFARENIGGGNWLLGGMLVAGTVLGLYALLQTGDADPDIGNDPCDAGATLPTGLAVFLFDFRKLLGTSLSSMPGVIFRESAEAAPDGTELRVYSLSGRSAMPLAVVDRVCKPPAPSGETRITDCAATRGSREHWQAAFCGRLGAIQRRVNDLAGQAPQLPVPDALLIEAIEEVRLVFEAHPGAGHRSLIIFSDMIQHAAWYSHLAPDAENWDFGAFQNSRNERAPGFANTSPMSVGVATEVFYVPRRGLTERPTKRDAHQRFWRSYFSSAEMPVVFRDQPVMPRFTAAPFPEPGGSLARVLEEREQLRREQREVAEVLALVEARQADLEAARQRAATREREFKSREEALLAAEAEQRREIEAERAEIARLEATLAARREVDDSS